MLYYGILLFKRYWNLVVEMKHALLELLIRNFKFVPPLFLNITFSSII